MSQSDILSSMLINQALDPHIYQELSSALVNLATASTQEDVDYCTNIFNQYQDHDEYIIYLVEIINNNLQHVSHAAHERLVNSAFAQLKNIVRKRWNLRQNGISNAGKECLINSIIRTSFNISSVQAPNLYYRYMKLLKDIISKAFKQATYLCPNIVHSIANACNSDQAILLLPVYLNIMLGISCVVIIQTQEDLYQLYSDMVKKVHPYLYQFAIKGGNTIHQLYNDIAENYNEQKIEAYKNFVRKYEEILYLSLKFFCKAIKGRLAANFREVAFEWMPIAQARIEYIDSTFTQSNNSEIDDTSNSLGYKGDDKFNYFHGKKWGLKFFTKVMTKILIDDKKNLLSDASRVKNDFYAKNFNFFVEFFGNIWSHQWPERILCELLNCLFNFMKKQSQRLGSQHPDMLKYFIGTMLPPLLRITRKQLSVLEEYAPTFIDKEENTTADADDVRMAATEVWLEATSIEYAYKPIQPKNKGKKDSFGMQLLMNWLAPYDPNTLQLRDMGCYLLLKVKQMISHENWMQQDLIDLINRVVTQNLMYSEGNYMILARALEIFTEYKKIINSEVLAQVKDVSLFIFNKYDTSLQLKQQHAYLYLRAGKAIQTIILYDRQLDEQELKMVVQKIFLLIKETSFEDFMNIAINILIECFRDLNDYAHTIAQFVQNWFKKFVEWDRQQFQQKAISQIKDNYSNLAKGTLEIYQTFIYFVRNGNKAVTEVIEKEIISIIDFLFANIGIVNDDYARDALSLLKNFLSGSRESKPPSSAILTLCKKILIKIPGLAKQSRQKLITTLNTDPNLKPNQIAGIKMYLTCEKMVCVDLQDYVGVISNFIQYFKYGEAVRSYDKIVEKFFNPETSNTEYLIYLVHTFHRSSYRKNKQQADEGKCFGMLMLIYYYQHHLDSKSNARVHPTVNTFTFRIIFQTVRQYATRPLFAKYNVQLFCLWLHEVKQGFQEYFSRMKQEDVKNFFFNIFFHKTDERQYGLLQLSLDVQSTRCIIGICCFLSILAKEQNFRNFLGYELIAEVITETIHMAYSGVETNSQSSSIEQNEDEQEQKDNKFESYNNKMKEVSVGLSNPHYPQRNKESYEQDEYQLENEEDEQVIGFDFDEAYEVLEEKNVDDIPKSVNYNEKIKLLNALYGFQQAAGDWYWKILETGKNKDKITDLLTQCGATTIQESKYLTRLVGNPKQVKGKGRLYN